LILALCLAPLLSADAWAQKRVTAPEIFHVYPAGGRQGTTCEAEILGGGLAGATNVHISGGGAQTAIVKVYQGASAGNSERAKQITALKERLAQARKQNPEDTKAQDELRTQLALVVGKKYAPDDGKGLLVIQVTLAPDAEPGPRELRVETPGGLSKPYPFYVGVLPEFRKAEVSLCEFSQNKNKGKQTRPRDLPPLTFVLPPGSPLLLLDEDMLFRGPPPVFTIPATLNGQIFPGQVDRYRFQARKGQQLVISAVARELKPYLADGSPGWFVAVLTLYDAKGNEVAYAQSYRFHPDPVIFHKVPADGQYTLEIRDSVYRGRYDFVYRISVGELPFVTGMFPLGGPAGKPTSVKLEGWNLPAATVAAGANSKAPGIEHVSVRNKEGVSNLRPFAVDSLPEILEQEPNNTVAQSQKVSLPIIVNGRIDPPGDRDVFRFEGKAGEEIVAEVQARRLDSPLDSCLKLTDAGGKQLAFNDDYEEKVGGAPEGWEDKGLGRETHHADSYIRATLPADGTYYLHLGDIQGKGGPEYAYRLHIRPAQPDFAVLVTKTSIGMKTGASEPLAVQVLPRDGFTGAVNVTLSDGASGFKLSNPYISPKTPNQIQFAITAPPAPTEKPVKLAFEGRATIQGREVVHRAMTVELMEQAFGGYYHAVPADGLVAMVTEPPKPPPPKPNPGKSAQPKATPPKSTPPKADAPKAEPSKIGAGLLDGDAVDRLFAAPLEERLYREVTAKIVGKTPIVIPIEGTARVQVSMATRVPLATTITLELREPPEGITMRDASQSPDGAEVGFALHADPAKGIRPGQKGNLTINVLIPRGRRPGLLGILPPLPFEIVAPAVSPPPGK
jgi:hypothetical protein